MFKVPIATINFPVKKSRSKVHNNGAKHESGANLHCFAPTRFNIAQDHGGPRFTLFQKFTSRNMIKQLSDLKPS